MTDTPGIDPREVLAAEARRLMRDLEVMKTEVSRVREHRNEVVRRMYRDQDMPVVEIAQATGLTKSLIRFILKI